MKCLSYDLREQNSLSPSHPEVWIEMSGQVNLQVAVTLHPEVWIEIKNLIPASKMSASPSTRRVWIEIKNLIPASMSRQFHPEVWIEIYPSGLMLVS